MFHEWLEAYINKSNEKYINLIINHFKSKEISKLLFLFPYKYNFYKKGAITDNFENFIPIIYGKVISVKKKLDTTIFTVMDLNHLYKKKFFVYFKYKLSINLKIDDCYYFIGEIKGNDGYLFMFFPKYQIVEPTNYIKPIYETIKGCPVEKIQEILRLIMKDLPPIQIFTKDIFYEDIIIKSTMTFNSILAAVHNIYCNNNMEELLKYIKYLKICEYLCFFEGMSNINGVIGNSQTIKYRFTLPINLTICQKNSIKDISQRLESPVPTVNFLQGDVGSGKTLVAFSCINKTLSNNFNSCFMAPTTILAHQHYENYKKNFPEFQGVLVEGGYKNKKYLQHLEDIFTYKIPTVFFGTHALLFEKLENISLIVIDEQHKFGMEQRKILVNKFPKSDVLFLSATPIPRTLFMLKTNQMYLNILKTGPFSKNIKTTIIKNKEEILKKIINISKKEKVLWINGAIDNYGEETKGKIGVNSTYEFFQNKKVESYLLHGKKKDEEKLNIIKNFQKGILVSTICVETGIDIDNLNYIVIEDASLFGLATLHQLRGRVGRKGDYAECILINNTDTDRLNILINSNDGFEIAEIDLAQRGAGSFFSKDQCGFYGFKSGPFNEKLFNLAGKIFSNSLFHKKEVQSLKEYFFKTLDVHY
jgi:ATP-dependent DNA helicase RecG